VKLIAFIEREKPGFGAVQGKGKIKGRCQKA